METLVAAILSGSFSLVGIWYQNYLQRQSNIEKVSSGQITEGIRIDKNDTIAPSDTKRTILRIFFSTLIAILPWLIWGFLIYKLNPLIYKNLKTYSRIMVLYFLIWLIVTITAILSGWKVKTSFEKVTLIASSTCLIYWGVWMIVHNLRNL